MVTNSHSRPMLYGTETTGFQHSWREVRVTTNDRMGSHGAMLFRWKRFDGDGEDRYTMEWYHVNHGVGDWYQGESDRNMSDEFFDARWDLIQDCLDAMDYGMSSKAIRSAIAEYLTPKEDR